MSQITLGSLTRDFRERRLARIWFLALLIVILGVTSVQGEVLYSVDTTNDQLVVIDPSDGSARVIGNLRETGATTNYDMVDVDLALSSGGNILYALNAVFDSTLEVLTINTVTAQIEEKHTVNAYASDGVTVIPFCNFTGEGLAMVNGQLKVAVDTQMSGLMCDGAGLYSLSHAIGDLNPMTGAITNLVDYYSSDSSSPAYRADVDGMAALPNGTLLSVDRIIDGPFNPPDRIQFVNVSLPPSPAYTVTGTLPTANPVINDVSPSCSSAYFYGVDSNAHLYYHDATPGATYGTILLDLSITPSATYSGLALACCPCLTAPSGIVGWWPLDETMETPARIAADLTGFQAGARVGSPVFVTGKVAGALRFPTSSDFVRIPDHPSLKFGKGSFSIDTWILTSDTSNTLHVILDKRVGTTSPRGFLLSLQSGMLQFQLGDGTTFGGNFLTASPDMRDGQWHHVAVTVDRDTSPGTVKLHVDGIVRPLFSAPAVKLGDVSNSIDLLIGRQNPFPGLSTAFNGGIDEVEIFNRALSDVEVRKIFLADSAGKCKPIRCAFMTYYRDADGDGFGAPNDSVLSCIQPAGYVSNGSDCNDGDRGLWGAPSEVRNLLFADNVSLLWTVPSEPGAASPVLYDAIRSDNPADFVTSATCIVADGTSTMSIDAQTPASGRAFSYLIRAQNGCPNGEGSLGAASDGTPRAGRSCP
jgi:hypothetical protein